MRTDLVLTPTVIATVFASTDDVALTFGDAEICRIAVSAILPRSCQTDLSNLEFRGAFAGVLRAF